MKSKFLSFLLVLALMNACTPAATPKNDVTPEVIVTATENISTSTPVPVPTNTPTPEPIKLPVDRFTSIPPLTPITLGNAADIEEVAQFNDSRILKLIVSEDKSKLAIQFASGVQMYDLPEVSPAKFTPLQISPFSRTIAMSEDGKYVARTYQAADHPLKQDLSIWNTETGKRVCGNIALGLITSNEFNLNFHPSQNTFSISGNFVASSAGDRGSVRFWNMDNCQKVFEAESDAFFSPPVSSDGKYTAVVKNEKVVVYDVTTRSQKTFGEVQDIRGIGFLPESGKVVVSYRGRTFLYDMASGENMAIFDASVGDYFSKITSLNNGEWVVVQAYEKNYFWNSAENKTYTVGEFFGRGFTFKDYVVCTDKSIFNLKTGGKISLAKYGFEPDVTFSPDSSQVAVSADASPYTVDIYETSTGKKIASLPDVHSPIAANNGTFIASGNGQTHFFNFTTGELVKSIAGEYAGGVAGADQQIILWNGLGEIGALDLNTGEMTQKSVMPVFPLGSIRYTQYPNSLSAWDDTFSTGFDNIVSALGADFSYDSFAVSSDRQIGIQEGANQLIQIYQGTDGILIPTNSQTLASYENAPFLIQFRFSPDDSVIAGASSQLILWDGRTGKQIKRFDLSIGATMDMRFSPDGSKLIVSGNTNGFQVNVFGNLALMVFDVPGKKLIHRYDIKQELRKVGCNVTLPFAITADGNQVFTLTQDCRIGLYDIQTFEEIKSFGSPYSDYALSFGLSPDGNLLAVALGQRFELWDVPSGKMIKRINIPELAGNFDNYFHRVVFSPDGKAVIVKSGVSLSSNSVTTVWGIPQMP